MEKTKAQAGVLSKLVDLFEDGFELYLFVVGMLGLFMLSFWFMVPKQHQGYYLSVTTRDMAAVFHICNNWRFYPDDTAFATTDKDEALRILRALNGGTHEQG